MKAFKFKVEKNIPLPKRKVIAEFPFDKLEIGDSFFVPKTITSNASLFSIISQVGKTNNKKFTSRKEGAGRRIWRIK